MKKRIICFLLTLCLTISGLMSFPAITFAATTQTAVSVGDEIAGFQVTQKDTIASPKAERILLTHKKTGARILVIKNNDKNRGFSIKFNTPAENNKGISHIIEHSVLSGSDKYPSTDSTFDIMNTTYTSFVNGMTAQNMTIYPVCSKNEKQLMKLADIYLDAVFHPLVLSDKNVFYREGMRYELKNTNSALQPNGIVYNEMKAWMDDIQYIASDNSKNALLSKSNQRFESGGKPNEIEKLTYNELIRTYKKNYTPSNSFMVLYGDVDYKAFLEMIDKDYLSSSQNNKVVIHRDIQKSSGKLI